MLCIWVLWKCSNVGEGSQSAEDLAVGEACWANSIGGLERWHCVWRGKGDHQEVHGTWHGCKRPKATTQSPPKSRLGGVGTLFVAQMRRALASSWYGEQGDYPTSRPAGQILLSQGELQPSNPVCEVLVYSSLSGI